jgi:CBS domain-containing protein
MSAVSGSIAREDALQLTVGEVMIADPKTPPGDATVGDVRRAFERPNVRTMLLADGDVFRGAIERERVPDGAGDDEPAVRYADTSPIAVTPATAMTDAVALLEQRGGEPRLIVVDDDGVTLRGLICVNSRATGFCVR